MSAKTKEINDSDDEIIETGWKIIEAEKVRKGKVNKLTIENFKLSF